LTKASLIFGLSVSRKCSPFLGRGSGVFPQGRRPKALPVPARPKDPPGLPGTLKCGKIYLAKESPTGVVAPMGNCKDSLARTNTAVKSSTKGALFFCEVLRPVLIKNVAGRSERPLHVKCKKVINLTSEELWNGRAKGINQKSHRHGID